MNTKTLVKAALMGLALPLLLLVDTAPEAPFGLALPRAAHALIGAPATPMSYAGVARRTTRTVVAVEATAVTASAATASAASANAAAASAAKAPPPAAAAPAAAPGSPAIGSVVTSLPAGCVSAPAGGVEYYRCGNVYYRTAFQGNNLVYVVQQP